MSNLASSKCVYGRPVPEGCFSVPDCYHKPSSCCIGPNICISDKGDLCGTCKYNNVSGKTQKQQKTKPPPPPPPTNPFIYPYEHCSKHGDGPEKYYGACCCEGVYCKSKAKILDKILTFKKCGSCESFGIPFGTGLNQGVNVPCWGAMRWGQACSVCPVDPKASKRVCHPPSAPRGVYRCVVDRRGGLAVCGEDPWSYTDCDGFHGWHRKDWWDKHHG